MIPARAFLLPPSPKANISPPTTTAIKLSPRAMGPVKASCNTVNGLQPRACSRHGPVRALGHKFSRRKREDAQQKNDAPAAPPTICSSTSVS